MTFSIAQAAKKLNLHPKTLRRWEEAGKYTPKRTLGNQRRYSANDITKLKNIKSGNYKVTNLVKDKLLTLEQTAKKLHVSEASIRRWTRQGKLKTPYTESQIQKYSAPERNISRPTRFRTKISESSEPKKLPQTIKWLKYTTIATTLLTLGLTSYLIANKPDKIDSPAIKQLNIPQDIEVAMPRVASFLDGQITIGTNTGTLSFLDENGNIYAKNTILAEGSIHTNSLQFLPSIQPESQIGRQYVDKDTGNLMYFDGSDWIKLNQIASNSATLNSLSTPTSTLTLPYTVLGGADQVILTIDDNDPYPVNISQPTWIAGNLNAPKFIDTDSSSYFLDPSDPTLSLVTAGDASISATLTFNKNGDYITNATAGYITISGGLGLNGTTTYGFNSNSDLTTHKGTFKDTLTADAKFDANGQVDLGDGDDTITISGSTISLTSADQILFKMSGDTDDYIYTLTDTNAAGFFFSGYTSNDLGIRANPLTNELEYRDENETTWTPLDSIADAGTWTDGGNYIYPKNYEMLRIYDAAATEFLQISHDSLDVTISNHAVGSINLSPNSSTAMTLLSNGNVGIGTTNPLQKLSVEGQCVTGDTLLPIIKVGPSQESAESAVYPNPSTDGEGGSDLDGIKPITPEVGTSLPAQAGFTPGVELTRIDQIKGGELIYSLNEQTGKLELQPIKGLLDMGIQPVYKLTTEDGKTITTTGNHPYLVKQQSSLLLKLNLTGKNHQRKSNNQNPPRNTGQIQRININHFAPFNKTNELYKDSIPYTKNFNDTNTSGGLTNEATNQATAILDENSDKDLTWDEFKYSSINNNHNNENQPLSNDQWFTTSNAEWFTTNNTEWTKVVYLNPGDEIAVVEDDTRSDLKRNSRVQLEKGSSADERSDLNGNGIKFSRILSIKYVGQKQVWDIEVENTHNFVGNGIIAHNTYISGNTGIGTTNPTEKLEVIGNIHATGSFISDGTTLDVPDYVFEDNYQLLSPISLQDFISTYHHLPGVPSRDEINQTGLNLSAVILNILEKTEENILYILDLYDRITSLEQRFLSPTIEAEKLVTNLISPLTNNGEIVIKGPVVIDSEQFHSGVELTVHGSASISGTLTANKINSRTIDNIKDKIADLVDKYETQTATASATPVLKGSEPSYSQLLASLQTADGSEPESSPYVASDSANLDIASINADFGFFSDYLAVMGTAIITNLNVTNTFSTNSISSLCTSHTGSEPACDHTLYLQPSGVGAINFLAGLMIMDSTGNIIINGNLTVTGTLIASEITSPLGQSLDIKIASESAVSIYNQINNKVASINASGSASFNKLNLKASGSATVSAGMNHAIIDSNDLTNTSQVIITFGSDYKPASKYWITKNPDKNNFTLFLNYPVNNPTKIDWLIIN
ncbi:MAG: MerR family transcriptional regulator [Candidatus Beckwithbacteria bacterium]